MDHKLISLPPEHMRQLESLGVLWRKPVTGVIRRVVEEYLEGHVKEVKEGTRIRREELDGIDGPAAKVRGGR